jgi:hypothetical protein
VDRALLNAWVEAYERAWRTPGTEVLSELFAPGATYSTAPFQAPYRGLEAIAELWEAEREGPDEVFRMESEILAVEGNTGVVRVDVRYGEPVRRLYRDLWIVKLDGEGRCVAFEEWPFWPEEGQAHHAPGPS